MEIVNFCTKVLMSETNMKIKFKRKIDWNFLFELFRDVFPTVCIDCMDMYDKRNNRTPVLNPDYIYDCEDIKEYKKFLKEEGFGMDLRLKYKWDIMASDEYDTDVRIKYDPYSDKNVIEFKLTCSPEVLVDTKKKLKELDK